ncbi:MAG TPA: hypothetical protein DFS52_05445 [Myxococcales bacterium]|nr:hypothetical protein [Myxococcales bacterium]
MERQANDRRKENAKRFALLLSVIALFGGPCTLQSVIGGPAKVPSQEEFASAFEKSGALASAGDAAANEQLLASSHELLAEQVRVQNNLRSVSMAFGGLLVLAYSLVFVFGLRAARFAPAGGKLLSFAALLVLPARVAVAAIDLAIARKLQPAIARAANNIAQLGDHGIPAADLERITATVGQATGWTIFIVQAAWALVVVLLFSQAWRYFAKPEVQALYPSPPEES